MPNLTAAAKPTLYFFGVTTSKSSIMKVFPDWAARLDLAGAEIKGVDFPLHAPVATYRKAVEFLKCDPLSLGALVTTHKIDLFEACRDLFNEIDPHARFMGETSCLSKRDGKLVCHAKDPISSGLSLDALLPERHFERTAAEVFAIGAGGSTIAVTWCLLQSRRGLDRPSRIVVSDIDAARLAEIQRIHARLEPGAHVEYVLATTPQRNDAVLASLKPGSLVINATGLGKDAPGSPLSEAARFPREGIAWDLNYRGDLIFLDQARAQAAERYLKIVDGWTYFLHGWTQVIAEVFHIEIPPRGAVFDALSDIARQVGKAS